ncbi:unnamed protein product [Rangifer tarandus platyrhynchus]|uniref:Uncharacterized protein n=1 Tax=Rangifer tarandus platyrhynchus TaxID=3082113 RepID=A0AC59ZZT1_RANTA
MQPMLPCSAPACWWWTPVFGLLLHWELQLGVQSLGFVYFLLLVMLPSEIPKLPTDPPVRGFPGVWKLLRLPPWVGSPFLTLFVPLFIFCPTSFGRKWAAFLGAWCPPPVFKSCFVAFAQRSNDLSLNLWGRKWSPRPIPPPS